MLQGFEKVSDHSWVHSCTTLMQARESRHVAEVLEPGCKTALCACLAC